MQSDPNKLSVFPAFVKVAGKTVIVVGGGDEAVAKLRLLSQTSADLVVIAANPTDQMTALVKQVGATLLERAYTFEDLADAALVFTALETAAEDRCVVEAARLAGVPVNAVDRPDMCDFITPAMVNRAPVTVAISTSGAAPVLARRIKATIEQLLPSQLGALAYSAANLREKVESFGLAGRAKRLFWEKFFDGPAARFAMRGDKESVSALAEELLNKADEGAGHVFLIGAGPGSADLLTLRAHKLLANADVVMHDALVSEEVINMSRRDAEIIPVGKRKGCHSKSQAEIDKLLVEKAKLGLKVLG